MAYTVELAIVLTGASRDQLYRWNRDGLLVPEISQDPYEGFLWSFRDILALRTMVRLRMRHSLQEIRKAYESLRELNLTDHPAGVTLIEDERGIYLVEANGEEITDLLGVKHHMVFPTLVDVMDQFPHPHEDGVVVDLRAPRERLRVNEHRLGGHPTVGDTRIPYDDVAALVATGEVRPEEVAEYYPGVTAEHARQAVDLAAQVDAGQGWVPLENAGRTA